MRHWFAQPGGRSDIAAALIVFAVLVFGALGLAERDRAADRAVDKQEIKDIAKRVVVIERQPSGKLIRRLGRNLTLCRRLPECADALDREPPPPHPKRKRRDRDKHAPDQRADRPPRTVTPPDPPTLDGGDGGDDPPPPSASTPVDTPTPSPAPQRGSSIVEVDVPPVDLDGDRGLLPQLLPEVNLPPVDLAPIRVP